MAEKDSTTAKTDDESIIKIEMDSGIKFVREIEVDSCNVELKLWQYSVGDVGCVVWDAGIVLAKYLDNLPSSIYQIAGKSAIDIGSGTGVAGLFAAALGANVILTDLPDIVPLLEKNIEINKAVLSGSASALVLPWGDNVEKLSSPDILLVADCIYYDMSIKKLIPTLVELSSENTDVFISYEDRDVGNKKELLRNFLVELRQYFDMEIIPASEQHPDFQSRDIYLLKCNKKNNHEGG